MPSGRLASDPWLLPICVSRVLLYAIFMVYAACLPVLRSEWGMSATQAGSIAGGFMFGYAISLVVFSWLAERFGAKRMFLFSAWVGAVSALAFGLFARSYYSGLLLYTLTAATQGGTYPPALMLLADRYDSARRGGAVGLLIASTSVGYAFSLLLSGVMLWRGGYQLAFLIMGSLPLVGAVIASWVLRKTPNIVHARPRGSALAKVLRRNANARRLIAGYTFHCWELLGMWQWIPAFLAASLTLAGILPIQAAALAAYLSATLHIAGAVASSSMGSLSDQFGRRALLLTLATTSTTLSFIIGWLIGWPVLALSFVVLIYGFTTL
ncbi:MAG: MFS transporter, partial [Acidiferrobacterales bacterium]